MKLSRAASVALHPCAKHWGFSGWVGWSAISFLAVSFLVQGLILELFDPTSASASSQPGSSGAVHGSADPTPPPPLLQADKNPGTPRISFADEMKLRPQSPEGQGVQPNIPVVPLQVKSSDPIAG